MTQTDENVKIVFFRILSSKPTDYDDNDWTLCSVTQLSALFRC